MAGRTGKKMEVKDIDVLEAKKQAKKTDALEKVADVSEIVNKHLEENDGAIVHPNIVSTEELIIKPATANTKTVKTDPWLNVRNKPSYNSDIIGKLFNGDIVTVEEVKDGFAKISPTEDKWVSVDYLE